MATIVTTKTVEFKNDELFDKPQRDEAGREFATKHSRVLDSIVAVAGRPTLVPDWVFESEHYKLLVADGDAKEVPDEYPIVIEPVQPEVVAAV